MSASTAPLSSPNNAPNSPPFENPQATLSRGRSRRRHVRAPLLLARNCRPLRPLLAPHRWRCITAVTLVAIVGLAVAIAPLFPKYVIDVAIPQHHVALAVAAGGAFLLSQFIRIGLWYGAVLQVYRMQQKIVFVRSLAFSHLQHLCMRFHRQYPSGFLYERVFGNSINGIAGFLQTIFQSLTTYLVGLFFSLAFCLYLSPALTAVILVGALGYAFAAQRLSKTIYAKTRAASEMAMRSSNSPMDKLRGHKTIQAFAMEARVQKEFEQQSWPLMMRWLDAVLESTKLGFVSEGLGYLITATVVVGGACIVMKEQIPLGTLVTSWAIRPSSSA